MEKISFNDVILLNEVLAEQQLNFRVHLRNVPGGQSIWIEPLGICACEGRYDRMYEVKENWIKQTKGREFTVGFMPF